MCEGRRSDGNCIHLVKPRCVVRPGDLGEAGNSMVLGGFCGPAWLVVYDADKLRPCLSMYGRYVSV
jgi:hypothetical protein